MTYSIRFFKKATPPKKWKKTLVFKNNKYLGEDSSLKEESFYIKDEKGINIAIISPIKADDFIPEQKIEDLGLPIGWKINKIKENNASFLDLTSILDQEKEEFDCILTGLLRGSVGSLISAGGTGKSILSLQLTIDLAYGKKNVFTRNTIPRNTCYISLEDPEIAVKNRLIDILKSRKIENKQPLKDNIKVGVFPGLIFLDKKQNYKEDFIDIFTDDFSPDLIIIDTARRAHTLDENSAGDMNDFLCVLEDVARSLDTAVLLLHHSSKQGMMNKAKGEDTGSTAARGSAVLVDNGRGTWVMSKINKDQAEKFDIDDRSNYVVIEHTKCNLEKAMPETVLSRGMNGLLSIYEQKDTSTKDKKKSPKNTAVI